MSDEGVRAEGGRGARGVQSRAQRAYCSGVGNDLGVGLKGSGGLARWPNEGAVSSGGTVLAAGLPW